MTFPHEGNNIVEHRSGWIKQQFQVNDASPDAWSTASGIPGTTVTLDAIDGIVGLPSTSTDAWIGLVVEIFAQTNSTYGASKGLAVIYSIASTTSLALKSLGNPKEADFGNDALADDDYFVVVGSAFGEGTEAPDATSDELEVVYNSTQIFKTTVDITGTLYQAALRGYSDELARLRMEKMKEHKIQKERAFLFGTRASGIGGTAYNASDTADSTFINHQTDANSKYIRTTMGIVQALRRYGHPSGDQQNLFTINASSFSWKDFVGVTEKVFQYIPNSGFKRAFCGLGALSYWNELDGQTGMIGKSGFKIELSDIKRDSFGFNYKVFETPHGILQLIPTPALRGPYHNVMVVIDDAHIKHTSYRPMKYQTNIKTDNAYDGVKDEYFSDEGVAEDLMETHSYWTINR